MNSDKTISETFARNPWPVKYQRLESHWLVACDANDLGTQPKACTILGVPLVLSRTKTGLAALLDRCPHRGAPLSSGRIVGDCIRCPYHGWEFDHLGECRRRRGIPEKNQTTHKITVPSFAVCEANGWIWVSLKSTSLEPVCKQISKVANGRAIRWNDETSADWVDGIENVLDATHTPFVHAGLVRSESASKQFDATLRVSRTMVEAEYTNEGKQAGWISRLLEHNRTVSYGRFIPPCAAQLEYQSTRGIEFLLNVYFTPTEFGKVALHSEVCTPQSRTPHWIRKIVLTPFLRRVYRQDFQILKQQQANLNKHVASSFVYWEGDLIRGWIETWLLKGELPQNHVRELKLQL